MAFDDPQQNELPEGSYFSTYFSGDVSHREIPFWLQAEIRKYLGVHHLPGWSYRHQLQFEVILDLASDVHSEEEFELLLELISHQKPSFGKQEDGSKQQKRKEEAWIKYADEWEEHILAVEEVVQRYVNLARKTYYEYREALYQLREDCVICNVAKKMIDLDVCASCRKLYWKEEQRIKIHLYRARKAGTPATLTLGQWINTLKRYDHKCVYCQGIYEVLEHYIPITSGGGTTEENCVPSCHKCNASKRNVHPEKM